MAYEVALRKRAVAAVAELGKKKAEVVEFFEISLASLNRWLKQQREEGHLEIAHSPGRPREVAEQGLALLVQDVKEQPDASLAERCEQLESNGYARVSRSTMQRMLARLAITRKKNASPSQTR